MNSGTSVSFVRELKRSSALDGGAIAQKDETADDAGSTAHDGHALARQVEERQAG